MPGVGSMGVGGRGLGEGVVRFGGWGIIGMCERWKCRAGERCGGGGRGEDAVVDLGSREVVVFCKTR